VAPVVNPAMVAAVVMPSAVLGDSSDSKYVLAPFFVPHFFFDCLVRSSTASSQISIQALIDHGSNAVLIDPLLANKLGLRHRKLLRPKEVIMAIGDGHKTFNFDEWVPIAVISSDQTWTSRTVCALFPFFWVALSFLSTV
jgi:hypothetical protein